MSNSHRIVCILSLLLLPSLFYSQTIGIASKTTNISPAIISNAITDNPLNTTATTVNLPYCNCGVAYLKALSGTPTFTFDWTTGRSITGGTFGIPVYDPSPPASAIYYDSIVVCPYGLSLGGANEINVGRAQNFNFSATIKDGSAATIGNFDFTFFFDSLDFNTTNPTCAANNDGTTTITGINGSNLSNYTFTWQPSGTTGATKNGLGAGNYTLAITGGCTDNIPFPITAPQPISINDINTPTSCGQNNGAIDITPSGGDGVFTYSWDDNATSQDRTGLTAATYTVTVTDGKGCAETKAIPITAGVSSLNVSYSNFTDISCVIPFIAQANIDVVGGTGPYTYSWQSSSQVNPNPTQSISLGTTPGTYVVTVTDNGGCTGETTVTITTPSSGTATITNVVQPSCGGAATGAATINMSGGTAPYSYVWTGGNTNTTNTSQNVTGINPGSFNVTVTDLNGCSSTSSVTINSAGGTITFTAPVITPASCGGTNGGASITASGGTGITYTWNTTPTAKTGSSISGEAAGSYTVTAVDASGCSATTAVTINSAGGGTVTLTNVVQPSCGGASTGSATITMTGGTAPYSYVWTGGNTNTTNTSQNVTGIASGTFNVTVTDAVGCVSNSSVTINSAGGTITFTAPVITPASCGGTNGGASITASGTGVTYTWNTTPTAKTGNAISGEAAGSYTVTAVDAGGCSATTAVTINSAGGGTVTLTNVVQPSCGGASTGSATITMTGGTAPYSYVWTGGNTNSTNTSQTVTGIASGSFNVTVTDAVGCVSNSSVTINSAGGTITFTAPVITPASCGGTNGGASITASGTGVTYTWNTTPTAKTGNAISGEAAGSYTVTAVDAGGCSATTAVTINSAGGGTVTLTNVVQPSCGGASTGSATITMAGGTAPYSYVWTGGNTNTTNTSQNVTGIASGSFNVTVTDAVGCVSNSSVTINSAGGTITFTAPVITPASCGGTNGGASITASGGTGITYTWNTTPTVTTGSAISNVAAGTYTVIAVDAGGCSNSTNVTVTSTGGGSVAITIVAQPSCSGANTGSATITMTGGTAPYSYVWTGGNTNTNFTSQNVSNISPGTFSVVVTDAAGCLSNSSVTINNLPVISFNTPTITPASCGASNGGATITATGGTGFTYTWNNASSTTGNTLSNVAAGTYTVTAVDAGGCSANTAVIINSAGGGTVSITNLSQPICGGIATGSLTITMTGGTTPYSYVWTGGNTNTTNTSQNISAIPAGAFNVTVTDAAGCISSSNTTIIQKITPVADFTQSATTGCTPLCVSFTDNSTISAGAITNWQWDLGNGQIATSKNASNCYNTAGSYTVSLTVTSSSGCTATKTATSGITVSAGVIADFNFNPASPSILEPNVKFEDKSTGVITNWKWDFDDNFGVSTLANPSYTFADTGLYCPSLIVSNVGGCADTVIKCLSIDGANTIYVPSAFTPNDDRTNNDFGPQGTSIKTIEMLIFDRWGNLIYKSTDINKPWNGRINNESDAMVMQQDVYVWTIDVTFTNNKSKTLMGHVTLVY